MNPHDIKPGESLYRDEGLKVYEASHYDDGSHVAEMKAILGWLPSRRGWELDLGCSGGLHSADLARRGFEVTGVDREHSAIALAPRRFGSLRGRSFQVMDLETADLSPLADAGRFTLVMGLGNVLSHLTRA
ncbi:MAG: class I SAM-dependent methyltransferase [Dehalococcoidia bacterium]|nr:class I SAM-dependent methyltransferase [Dehalococcoidia bacterium]